MSSQLKLEWQHRCSTVQMAFINLSACEENSYVVNRMPGDHVASHTTSFNNDCIVCNISLPRHDVVLKSNCLCMNCMSLCEELTQMPQMPETLTSCGENLRIHRPLLSQIRANAFLMTCYVVGLLSVHLNVALNSRQKTRSQLPRQLQYLH